MRVEQAFVNRAQEGVVGGVRHLQRAIEVAIPDGVKRLV
jgi:hypothetical protein